MHNKCLQRRWALLTLATLGLTAACADESAMTPTPSALDDIAVNALSTDQRKTFCDEVAGAWGGYDKTYTCPDGSTDFYEDQAQCLDEVFISATRVCTAKAGAVKACIAAIAKQPCEVELPAACKSLPKGCR